jgi:hypothetical protein
MTPLKRRKWIRRVVILAVVMMIGLLGRYLFRDQSIASLLLGRKPGSAAPGTQLLRADPQLNGSPNIGLPPEARSPIPLSFGVIGDWKYVEGKTPIPQKVLQLDGKWVEMSGFMFSNNEAGLTPRFNLVQSLWSCCFGNSPELNHVIDVRVKTGSQALYYPDPVKVIGKFSVGEYRENGELVSIYRLEAYEVVVK